MAADAPPLEAAALLATATGPWSGGADGGAGGRPGARRLARAGLSRSARARPAGCGVLWAADGVATVAAAREGDGRDTGLGGGATLPSSAIRRAGARCSITTAGCVGRAPRGAAAG
jgi:hypothetical protein